MTAAARPAGPRPAHPPRSAPAAGPVAGPAGVALRDELPRASGSCRRQQMISALGTQAIGGREHAVETAQVRDPGQRVIWWITTSGAARPTASPTAIASSPSTTAGAQRPQAIRLGRAAGRGDDLVARRDQARHQPLADHAGRAGDKHSHDGSSAPLCPCGRALRRNTASTCDTGGHEPGARARSTGRSWSGESAAASRSARTTGGERSVSKLRA